MKNKKNKEVVTNKKNLTTRNFIDSISVICPNKKQDASSYIRYDKNGKSDLNSKSKLSDDQSCALESISGSRKIFKIKMKKDGSLYDPTKESNSYILDGKNRFDKSDTFVYRSVGEKKFQTYIKFLQTKNNALLLVAEREL